jgi:hypothetical protein
MDNHSNRILLFGDSCSFEEMIYYDNFINLFAVNMVANLDVFFHLTNDLLSFLFDEVDVLLLFLLVLLAFKFILDFLHGVSGHTVQFLLDIALHIAVIFSYLSHLVNLVVLFDHG